LALSRDNEFLAKTITLILILLSNFGMLTLKFVESLFNYG